MDLTVAPDYLLPATTVICHTISGLVYTKWIVALWSKNSNVLS